MIISFRHPAPLKKERERERERVTAAEPVEKVLSFFFNLHFWCSHYGHKLLKFLIPRSFRRTQPLPTPRQYRAPLYNKYLNPRLTPPPYNLLIKYVLTNTHCHENNQFKTKKMLNKQWIHTFYAIDNIVVKVTFLTGFTASYCN